MIKPTDKLWITIYKNPNKSGDKHPDVKGYLTMPDGTELEIVLWNELSKKGNPVQKGHAKLPDPKYQKAPTPSAPKSNEVEVDF